MTSSSEAAGDADVLPASSICCNVAAPADAEVVDVVRGADRVDRVDDDRTPADLEQHVDPVCERVAAERGWRLRRHTCDLVGCCASCAGVTPGSASD